MVSLGTHILFQMYLREEMGDQQTSSCRLQRAVLIIVIMSAYYLCYLSELSFSDRLWRHMFLS